MPNLTEYLARCSSIYLKVTNQLPSAYTEQESFIFPLTHFGQLRIVIDERKKFTDALTVHFEWLIPSLWLTNLAVHLKLYHDLKVAEVVSYISNGKVVHLNRWDSTQKKMSYPVEKEQMNHLLSEWLALNLKA